MRLTLAAGVVSTVYRPEGEIVLDDAVEELYNTLYADAILAGGGSYLDRDDLWATTAKQWTARLEDELARE